MDVATPTRRRTLGTTAKAMVSGVLGLVCVGSAAAMAASSWAPWQLQNDYNNAPRCTALSIALAGGHCRYTTTGVIVDPTVPGGEPSVSIRLPAAGDRIVTADYPLRSGGQFLAARSVVPVELWEGRVTLVAGGPTGENPWSNQTPGDVLLIAAVMAVLGVALVAWAIYSWRHRPSDSDRPHSTGSMNPVAVSQLLNNR